MLDAPELIVGRRNFLMGGSALLATPAIIRVAKLMLVRVVPPPPLFAFVLADGGIWRFRPVAPIQGGLRFSKTRSHGGWWVEAYAGDDPDKVAIDAWIAPGHGFTVVELSKGVQVHAVVDEPRLISIIK